MPNPENVCAPLSLVAYGRSGTSVLQAVFEAHPMFEVAGETTELIFGAHLAVEMSRDLIRGQTDPGGEYLSQPMRAALAARAALLSILPSDKPHWMQKPIGLPMLRPYAQGPDKSAGLNGPCPPEWYWSVLKNVFPKGRYFTVLRQPCDVVLSAIDYWGWDERVVWQNLADHCRILMHEASQVEYAVNFENLVEDPEAAITRLFEKFEIPWHDCVMCAMKKIHVPGKGRANINPRQMSRRDQWRRLNPSAVPPGAILDIDRLWHKFDLSFELPDHLIPMVQQKCS